MKLVLVALYEVDEGQIQEKMTEWADAVAPTGNIGMYVAIEESADNIMEVFK